MMSTDELQQLYHRMKSQEGQVGLRLAASMPIGEWLTRPTWEPHREGNQFAGIAKSVLQEGPCELPRFAWPGGYDCTFVTGDGDELCWKCAQTQVDENISHLHTDWNEIEVQDLRRHTSPDETIVAIDNMSNTDSCVMCDDCGEFVTASGCETFPASVVSSRREYQHVGHGEYCRWNELADK